MATLADQSVQTCVTSPPYFGLRDYGNDGQIGLESTPDAYVAELVAVFREVRRVLKDDGTLWLNLGDSYARSAGPEESKLASLHTMGVGQRKAHEMGAMRKGENRPPEGLKPKDLIGIPWRVAFALQADGWYLRQDIIWHKPNPMPESVTDRCTKAHEYVFLLSKSARYYYDADAIAEPSEWFGKDERSGMGNIRYEGKRTEGDATKNGQQSFVTLNETRNRRSVWTVATKPYAGAHFATFPPDLIEPCILAGSKKGDLVLDPFGGSGTTGAVATGHGRDAVLCELNPDYADLAVQRIGPMFTTTEVIA
jgi:DNA modification methylase